MTTELVLHRVQRQLWLPLFAIAVFAIGVGIGTVSSVGDPDESPARYDQAAVGEVVFGQFVETDQVDLVLGGVFGWNMHLSDGTESVVMREEFVLPAPPTLFGGYGSATTHSADGLTAITEMVVYPQDGWIESTWQFTTGDPEGEYIFRVYLDDELAKEFRFEVQRPAEPVVFQYQVPQFKLTVPIGPRNILPHYSEHMRSHCCPMY